MADNVYALLQQAWSVSKTADANLFGVEVAIVTNVQDPEKQGRVKVCFPRLPGKPESDWARVAQPSAGPGRGFYWLPEVNDEVLVAFERGAANVPYVIGALWNGKDKPMKDAYTDENTTRMVQTKSGHQLVLNDKDGEEKIILADKSGKRTVTWNVPDKKFLVEAKEGDVELHAEKKIVLQCEDLEIKTKKTGKIEIGSAFSLKVAQKASFKAGPQMNLKADAVEINPSSLSIEALVTAAEEAVQKAIEEKKAAAEEKKQEEAAAAGPSAAGGPDTVPTSDGAPAGGAAADGGAGDDSASAAESQPKAGSAAPDGTAWTKAPGEGNKAAGGDAATAGRDQSAEAKTQGQPDEARTDDQSAGKTEDQPAETKPDDAPADAQPQPEVFQAQVRLLDEHHQPVAGAQWKGESVSPASGQADDSGVATFEFGPDVEQITLSWGPDSAEGHTLSLWVKIPADDAQTAGRRRLDNLGFTLGPALEDDVRAFQAAWGLALSGALADIADALAALHDDGKEPAPSSSDSDSDS